MDNLCHTLAGAALAESGLKRTTRFGTLTLLMASNLPDVDALVFLGDTPAVALRRGWTHGVLAQALLPMALTAVLLAIDRWRPPGPAAAGRARPLALLGLSLLGVVSHVALDWLNTYGVRFLMPFTGRWFYGDSVFIVDPWLWLALGLGVLLSRRRRTGLYAQVAVGVAAAYIGLMILSASVARGRVAQAWRSATGAPAVALMVGPVPLHPLRKQVIVDAGGYYHTGSFDWLRQRTSFDPRRIPSLADHPAARAARGDPDVQAVLVWARFPRYEIEQLDGGHRVTLSDMRYGRRVGAITRMTE